PRNEMEASLLAIWQEVLGQEQISVKANFFEAGGHSLKAVQMISAINAKFGVDVQHKDAFIYTTITELAAHIANKEKLHKDKLVPIEEQDYYNVSHAQKRLWILNSLEEKQVAYNIPTASLIEEKINLAYLNESLQKLYERHESLRTVFVMVGNEPKQKIKPQVDFKVRYLDWSTVSHGIDQAVILAHEEAVTPFDLAAGPLLRVTLIHLADTRSVLFFTVHHIVVDAVSMQNMMAELMYYYNTSLGKSARGDFRPLSIQYKDFSAWQNQQLAKENLKMHQNFWVDQFKEGVNTLNFPADFERPEVFNNKGRFVHFELEKNLAAGIRNISKENQTTLFMTSLALVCMLINKYTKEDDITVGTPVAGREDHKLVDQIGFFVNMLPLRNKIDIGKTFRALLQQIRGNVLEAFDHQVYPYDKLVNDLKIPRDRSRNPLFDVVVTADTFAEERSDAKTFGSHKLMPLTEDRSLEVCKYDLRFRFSEVGDSMYLNILYNQSLFKHERMLIMKERLKTLIAEVVDNPDKTLTEYKMEAKIEQMNIDEEIFADFDF
ncbi:MAG: condensation domain-containing protein, partial [Bacteroidota bacterium]